MFSASWCLLLWRVQETLAVRKPIGVEKRTAFSSSSFLSDQTKKEISSDFLTAFAKLPRQVQGKVTEFVNKFRNNPMSPGLNYEKLNSGSDKKIYSVRIDDTYRGIVVRQPESGVYLLLWIDHHDEA